MDDVMERIKAKYRDIPTTHIRMFADMYLDLTVQKKWSIPELAVVSTAICGSFATQKQNPHQPITNDAILAEAMASIEAGAASVHLHVRDEKTELGVVDLASYHRVIDPIKKKYGDKVVIDGSCFSGDSFEKQMAPVTDHLFETGPVACFAAYVGDTVRYWAPKQTQAAVEYMQEKGVKVQLGIMDTGHIDLAKRWLIDTGILQKPYFWILTPALPGNLRMESPRTMIDSLNMVVSALKEIDEHCFIMVCSAGRASIYVATLALLMGLHVRVGMEDTLWKYPHMDDLLSSNREVTKEICQIIRLLGRRVATAEEYRQLIGLRK